MRFSKALVALGLIVGALTVRSSAQPAGAGRFAAGEILVKFRPGANANERAEGHSAAGAAPLVEITRTGVERVRVPAGAEAATIARYQRNPNVLYAERNAIRTIPMPTAQAGGAAVVPGDYYFDEQWGFDNTGQGFSCIPWIFGELCLYSGTPDADIDAPEAWAIVEGSPSVTVAVIDSGVDYNHPDLAANYAGGYDFVSSDSDPMDDHGHGTHVAGTIAAALGNVTGTPPSAEGVAGVAPNARIRAYKVCRSDGTCDDFAIQQAIAQAITDGVNVINMSLGEAEYSQSLNDAVQAAWNAGLVIVAGAGNNGTTDLFYPAAFDNVISVASFDEDHNRSSFSNYGSWVDISAPGSVIMSTYPLAACSGSTTPGDTGCYTWNSGTSMATPHVAGAAALLWSRSDVTSNSQVVDILLNSADGQGVSNVRLDSWTIHGGLNLHNAVSDGLTNLPPDAEAGPDQTVTDTNGNGSELVSLDGSASSDEDGTIASYEWREGSTSIATGATPTVTLSVGVHTLTLEVTDDDGDSATDSVIVTINPANQVTVVASITQATEAGSTNGMFSVTRTGDTSAPLTVQYTVAGTALAGTDYTTLPGAVTIGEGASTATVAVTPIDDAASESDESVVLTVVPDAAYGLGSPSTATVTIVSDDLPPDLVVTVMTVPATAAADTDIVVSDTTKNQGTGASLPSKTGFYLSTNSTLDAADIWLGTRLVPALAPGATNVWSTTLHVPPSTASGSYRIIGKADWDSAVTESVETNNTKSSSFFYIGPDLIISALTTPVTAAAGAVISVTDTTRNQGGSAAAASTTRFYWSTNTSVDASDQMIGSRSVPLLAAGATASATTTLTVPATAATGTYYYIVAQADDAGDVAETVETNNGKAGAAIRVGADLTVTAMTAPATGAPGGTISVTDTTKNEGAGAAAASATGFYLSVDSTPTADEFIGSRQVAGLASNGTATASTVLQIPVNTLAGNYYVIAAADWNSNVAEATETNNTRASGVIRIGGDLVVTAVTAPSSGMANGPITVTDTTRNQGAVSVQGSVTGFYLSTNSAYDAMDVFLGSRVVPSLGPSVTDVGSTQLIIPPGTATGSYKVIAVADMNNAVAESVENNNIRASGDLRIGPDLIVYSLTVHAGGVAGSDITVTENTQNQGGAPAPASVTYYYLSTNSTLDAADLLLATRPISLLGAGLSDTATLSLAIPAATTAGNYYVIARSDGNDAIVESLENNNNRARYFTVTAAPPP